MLMSLPDLHRIYNFQVTGILHLGAHLAEEAEIYKEVFGDVPVWWVEANPRTVPKIKRKLRNFRNQEVIHALVYKEDDVDLEFNVTNLDGMSSSILQFGTHTSFSPEIKFVETVKLPTSKVDSLVERHSIEANFLNMDLQGAEMMALLGAPKFLTTVNYILTEVNDKEVYIDCAKVKELDKFLKPFKRVKTSWVGDQGWGDALYVRRGIHVRYR